MQCASYYNDEGTAKPQNLPYSASSKTYFGQVGWRILAATWYLMRVGFEGALRSVREHRLIFRRAVAVCGVIFSRSLSPPKRTFKLAEREALCWSTAAVFPCHVFSFQASEPIDPGVPPRGPQKGPAPGPGLGQAGGSAGGMRYKYQARVGYCMLSLTLLSKTRAKRTESGGTLRQTTAG